MEAPPRPPRIWPWLLALLVLVGAGLGALYGLTRDDDEDTATRTTTAGAVQVPEVVGQPVDRATALLLDAGLDADLRRTLSERQSGVVLEQDPAAGQEVDAGTTVVLTVARGEGTVAVPRVVGLPAASAFAAIQDAGLRPTSTRVFAEAPVGEVVSQQPGAGNEVESDSTVALRVSKGEQRVDVPEVTGLGEEDAVAALDEAGFEAGVLHVPSSEPEGTVVAQSPKAGEQAAKGKKVQINVSSGSAATTTTGSSGAASVPDVVGLGQATAARELRQAGFRVETRQVPSNEPLGRVVAQFPAAGTTADDGATVRINVSQGRPAKAVPDVVGDDEVTATDRLERAGFSVDSVQQETADPAEDGIVVEQDPAAGERRRPGATVTITVGVLSG